MHTVCLLTISRSIPCLSNPLDADPTGCRPLWMQTPLDADPTGCRPPCHVTRDTCWEAIPPVNRWHTGIKTLLCPNLHFRTVTINQRRCFHFRLAFRRNRTGAIFRFFWNMQPWNLRAYYSGGSTISHLLFWQFSSKNCMKLRKKLLGEGRAYPLLAFVVICLIIISEWPSLSHNSQ